MEGFICRCGHQADRDTNAAANLARWGHTPHLQAAGRATNARRLRDEALKERSTLDCENVRRADASR